MSAVKAVNMIPTWYNIDHDKKIIDFNCELDNNLSTLESAEIAVDFILKTYPKPYYVMVSGGIDSQATLYSWKLFGKDFIPTAVRFNGLNDFDLIEIYQFVKQHQLELNLLDFDVLNFYETEYVNYVQEYKLPSPHLTVHIAMTKSLPGTIIMSGNFLAKPFSIYSTQIGLTYEAFKRPFIPFFFWATPDLAYSLLKYRKSNGYTARGYNQYDIKLSTYHDLGFPVIAQKQKFSGFEQIKEIYKERYKNTFSGKMKLDYVKRKGHWTPYEWILRYPYEESVGLVNYTGLLNPEF